MNSLRVGYCCSECVKIEAIVIPELKFSDAQWHILGTDLVDRADHASRNFGLGAVLSLGS
jgi:hypothetical protein